MLISLRNIAGPCEVPAAPACPKQEKKYSPASARQPSLITCANHGNTSDLHELQTAGSLDHPEVKLSDANMLINHPEIKAKRCQPGDAHAGESAPEAD